jgi:hypothetical protein
MAERDSKQNHAPTPPSKVGQLISAYFVEKTPTKPKDRAKQQIQPSFVF